MVLKIYPQSKLEDTERKQPLALWRTRLELRHGPVVGQLGQRCWFASSSSLRPPDHDSSAAHQERLRQQDRRW
jgi:hypothetical protein